MELSGEYSLRNAGSYAHYIVLLTRPNSGLQILYFCTCSSKKLFPTSINLDVISNEEDRG